MKFFSTFGRKLFVISMAMLCMLSISGTGISAQKGDTKNYENPQTGEVTFKNIKENPNQSYSGVDKEGNEYTVSIEPVGNPNARAYSQWKLSYTSGVINCHFYMDVSSNKCTSVYDKWILTIGAQYSDEKLTRTTTYGKLSFNVSDYFGIIKGTCWIKGTVTGSSNDVKLSYSM